MPFSIQLTCELPKMVLLTPSEQAGGAGNSTTSNAASNATGLTSQLQGLTDALIGNAILVLAVVTVAALIVVVAYLFMRRRRRALISDQKRGSAALVKGQTSASVQSFTPPVREEDTIDLESTKLPADQTIMPAQQLQQRLWVASGSDMGLNRDHNEDTLLVDIESGLLLVADGVGGSQAGEIASRLAAECVARYVKMHSTQRPLQDVLREAVVEANGRIYKRATDNPAWTGMGSTVVAALCSSDALYVVHEGDSRAYLINNSTIKRITRDNSVIAELIEKGRLTPDEAHMHPERHVVTKWLGTHQAFQPELNFVSWGAGDYLLLCSDGLTDMVDDFTIKAIITDPKQKLEAKCERLIELANENGGVDNITIVLAYHS